MVTLNLAEHLIEVFLKSVESDDSPVAEPLGVEHDHHPAARGDRFDRLEVVHSLAFLRAHSISSISKLPGYVNASPVLDGIDQFDAHFFGFSARNADLTDPQHRLFLESAWQALEDAGYAPGRYPGAIGVFGGCELSSYLGHLYKNF